MNLLGCEAFNIGTPSNYEALNELKEDAMRRLSFLMMPLLLLMLPSLVLAQPRDTEYWHGMMWGGGPGWMMFFGPLMMILFWGTIILLVVLAIRRWGGPSRDFHPPPQKTALEILQERFARGEINKEEYEEKRRLLTE